jgi:hypothetical protein
MLWEYLGTFVAKLIDLGSAKHLQLTSSGTRELTGPVSYSHGYASLRTMGVGLDNTCLVSRPFGSYNLIIYN